MPHQSVLDANMTLPSLCVSRPTLSSSTHIRFPRSRQHIHSRRQTRGLKRSICNAKQSTESEPSTSSKADDSTPSNSLLSFLCPLLKVFGGNVPATERPRWLEVATSGIASITRMPYGTSAGDLEEAARSVPTQPPVVYEFEACPFCRRVREAVTDLDMTVDVYPCPKGSIKHRADVMERGGKSQFPYLIDANTDTKMYESDDIVRYLYKTYGGGSEPPSGLLESTLFTGWMPTLLRAGRGMSRWSDAKDNPPEKLLELYNYENNQFSRLVREVLCELELPYRCISAGKGSKNRMLLQDVQGKTTVPFLVDPNTNTSVGDSEEIIKYLLDTYSD